MSKHFSHILIGLIFITVWVSACQPPPTATPEPSTPTAVPSPTAIAPLEEGTRAPLWTFATQGEVWSSPTVADGTVCFGSLDGKLYAVAK